MASIVQYWDGAAWQTENVWSQLQVIDSIKARSKSLVLTVVDPANVLQTSVEADGAVRYSSYRQIRILEEQTTQKCFWGKIEESPPDRFGQGGSELRVFASDYLQEVRDNPPLNAVPAGLRASIIWNIVNGIAAGITLRTDPPGVEWAPNLQTIGPDFSTGRVISGLVAIGALAQSEPWCDPDLHTTALIVQFDPPGGADVAVALTDEPLGNLAQSFSVAGTDILHRAYANLRSVGTPLGNVYVRIEQDNVGPNDALDHRTAESDPVVASSIGGAFGSVRFSFDEPWPVFAASVYWLVLCGNADYDAEYVTSGGANRIEWQVDTTNAYAGGQWATYTLGGGWAVDGARDGYLRIGSLEDAVWRHTIAGAWVNHTAAAQSDDAADFPWSPEIGENTYVGACAPFYGLKLQIDAGDQGAGYGTYVFEYWNGTAWTALTMLDLPDVTAAATAELVEWDMPLDWKVRYFVTGDPEAGAPPDDIDRFWIRFRQDATPAPIAQVDKVTLRPGYGYDFYVEPLWGLQVFRYHRRGLWPITGAVLGGTILELEGTGGDHVWPILDYQISKQGRVIVNKVIVIGSAAAATATVENTRSQGTYGVKSKSVVDAMCQTVAECTTKGEALAAQLRDDFLFGSVRVVGWPHSKTLAVVTGTDNSGVNDKVTSLVDTIENFKHRGIQEGDIIRNTTDGSSGIIDSISTTTNPNDTLNFSGGLSGGTDNDFDDGDTYAVDEVRLLRAGQVVRVKVGTWLDKDFFVTELKYGEPEGIAEIEVVESLLKPSTGLLSSTADMIAGVQEDARTGLWRAQLP